MRQTDQNPPLLSLSPPCSSVQRVEAPVMSISTQLLYQDFSHVELCTVY